MSRLGVLAVVLFLAGLAPAPELQRGLAVRRGSTRDEVKDALGPPQRISRQLLFRRHLEQWHYAEPTTWVEFNCVRGEESYVVQFRLFK